ncbi:hypothetical protein [Rahnella sp. BIGb0236]|nr:hypothetical protein [Rahnella sp. BIGb0236]
MKAKIKPDIIVVTRPVQGGDDNLGCGIEVAVPQNAVDIIEFKKY